MRDDVDCCPEYLQTFLRRLLVCNVESLRLVEFADLRQRSGISDNGEPIHCVAQVMLAILYMEVSHERAYVILCRGTR